MARAMDGLNRLTLLRTDNLTDPIYIYENDKGVSMYRVDGKVFTSFDFAPYPLNPGWINPSSDDIEHAYEYIWDHMVE